MTVLLDIQNLTKNFGGFCAVDNVSFQVKKGEVLGFLGPNGAGKTTTMQMITGYLPPTSGTAQICGHDILKDTLMAQSCIGYLPEGAPLYADMTPRMMLNFVAEVRGMSLADTADRIVYVQNILHLDPVMDQAIETLSKGYKRRVGCALSLVHDPDVLILDEPTDGIDPNQKHEMRELIRALRKDKAILISTHILEEVDAVCDRAIIIAHGKIVAEGTPKSLIKAHKGAKTIDDVFRIVTTVDDAREVA